jgi:hypothetical protein
MGKMLAARLSQLPRRRTRRLQQVEKMTPLTPEACNVGGHFQAFLARNALEQWIHSYTTFLDALFQ